MKNNYPKILFFFFLLGTTSLLGQIKIGDNIESISSYSLLEMESTTQGLLLPRMTTAQRDSAFNQDTPVGMVIFNTDTNSFQFYMEEVDTSFRRTGLKVWQNTAETKIENGLTPPESAVVGNLFYETENGILYFYDGTEWVAVNSNSSNNIGSSTVFEDNSITFTQSDGSTATLNLEALQTSSGTDSQTLSLTGNILEISNGNSVDLEPLLSAYSLTTTSTIGTTGPAGSTGPAGPAGVAGLNGSGLIIGTGIPTSNVVSPTLYVDQSSGDQYYNTGGGSTWTLLPSSDNQNLTASALSANNTMTLAISNGNTVTLDFSSFSGGSGTDSQTIAFGNSATTTQTSLEISEGNSLSLQASGSLSFTQTGTDTLVLTARGESVAATQTHSSQRFNGTNWVEDPTRLSDGSSQVTVTTDLNVVGDTNLSGTVEVTGNTSMTSDLVVAGNTTTSGTLTANSTTTLNGALVDGYGNAGVAGQILSTTGTETQWITTGALPATAGQNTNTTTYWNGSAWVNNQNLLSDGTNVTSITTDLSVTATDTTINSNLTVTGDNLSLTGTTTINGDAINLTGPTTITGNATVTQDLTVAANTTTSGTLTANSTVTFNRAVVDGQGNAGSPGQLLSSTGTQTSWISIAGETVTSTTSNYNASIDDDTILVLPTAAVTIILPTPTGDDNGKKLTVKRGNVYTGPADTLAIVPSTGTIDGAANLRLNVGYQGYTLQAFAGNWYIIQRF